MNERHGYCNEMPLPTYEEVVGASGHNVGFKAEVLRRPRTYNNAESHRVGGELVGECGGVPDDGGARWKQWSKKYFGPIVAIILAPLLFLFIFLQLKSCAPCLNKDVQSSARRLQVCSVAMTDISRRYDKIFNDLQHVQKQRDEVLKKLEDTKTQLKNLRSQYEQSNSVDLSKFRDQLPELREKLERCESEYNDLLKQIRDNPRLTASPQTPAETTTPKDMSEEDIFKDLNWIEDSNILPFARLHKMLEYYRRVSNEHNPRTTERPLEQRYPVLSELFKNYRQ